MAKRVLSKCKLFVFEVCHEEMREPVLAQGSWKWVN